MKDSGLCCWCIIDEFQQPCRVFMIRHLRDVLGTARMLCLKLNFGSKANNRAELNGSKRDAVFFPRIVQELDSKFVQLKSLTICYQEKVKVLCSVFSELIVYHGISKVKMSKHARSTVSLSVMELKSSDNETRKPTDSYKKVSRDYS